LRGRRPSARGKSIYIGGVKKHIRGVTYGTFRSDAESGDFPRSETVAADFAAMAENGVNAVRTYTVPPQWLLDLARDHDLYVIVGIPWEEHVTFLDERGRAEAIMERIREGVRACARHPAVLAYAIGNEIPASIVRWHGRKRIERFLHKLYRVAKEEDPDGLVTYVNYPSTEYLQLPFVDLVCFNIFLESGPQFEVYLARLQNIAGDRPLIVTEVGLDSLRHNEQTQAAALDWQVRSAFGSGCAGVFVFSWTDEWNRGGFDIHDWDFGLVDRQRRPKMALGAVRKAFGELPFPRNTAWPRVSVVVCSYNGESTLPECFEGLKRLDYPDYEVIVVNDGSTDRTEEITRSYGYRLISTSNKGLGAARNIGLEAADGEIIAYIDNDACPDPHWLKHLTAAFIRSSHAAVGGPNIPPPDDDDIAECVANAPGGPIHVLLSDREAEHIPGCNMAFRKSALEAIGGFDPQFRIAGDDVDICWRLHQDGCTIGYAPGAVVWHRRRGSIRRYFKQQLEYGKAEALLERKWPARYNRVGHLAWAGRVYRNGTVRTLRQRRWKIYYGTWGTGLFQSVYQRAPGTLGSLPLMPEWYLVIAMLAGLSAIGLAWQPLLLALPLLVVASGALALECAIGGARPMFPRARLSRLKELKLRSVTSLLYALQPLARLSGRLRFGLAPWRRRPGSRLIVPRPRTTSMWSERWQSPDERLRRIDAALRRVCGTVVAGGDYDRWDVEVRGGLLGSSRTRMTVEEHGAGRQLVRIQCWPHGSKLGLAVNALIAALAIVAVLDGASLASVLLGSTALLLAVSAAADCAASAAIVQQVLHEISDAGTDGIRIERVEEPGLVAEPELETAAGTAADANGRARRRLPSDLVYHGFEGAEDED
jgi:GT2 family glycosyltransferase